MFLFVSNNLSASRDLSNPFDQTITINPLTNVESLKGVEERGEKGRGKDKDVHRVANREKKLRYEKAHPPYDNPNCTG